MCGIFFFIHGILFFHGFPESTLYHDWTLPGWSELPPKGVRVGKFLFLWVLAGFFPEDIRLCQDLQKQRFANSDTFGGSSEHPGSVQSRYKVDSENPWEKISMCGKKIPHMEISNVQAQSIEMSPHFISLDMVWIQVAFKGYAS